jgi:uncharacterized membrane protein YedE/YeeE
MGRMLAALGSGIVFGMGLAIAEMTNPAKVQNFLDFLGTWDPSLALVMGAALATTGLAFPAILRRRAPLIAGAFSLPTLADIDPALVMGAAIFGVGWGLGGFCPGPALAGLLQGVGGVYVFVAAMLLGMLLHRAVVEPLRARATELPARAPGRGQAPGPQSSSRAQGARVSFSRLPRSRSAVRIPSSITG